MLGPTDVKKIKKYNIEKLIEEIDVSIKKFHGWYPWEDAIVEDELPLNVRNEIAIKYLEAGWVYVYHNTTSENGERAGLTGFSFSEKHLEHDENKYLVMKSELNEGEYVVYRNNQLVQTI